MTEALVPRCHIPWQQMVIDSTGAVAPCCYWGAYNNTNPPVGKPQDANARGDLERRGIPAAACRHGRG
jgi:hypothetical protein